MIKELKIYDFQDHFKTCLLQNGREKETSFLDTDYHWVSFYIIYVLAKVQQPTSFFVCFEFT